MSQRGLWEKVSEIVHYSQKVNPHETAKRPPAMAAIRAFGAFFATFVYF
jgi:hypothetical protein